MTSTARLGTDYFVNANFDDSKPRFNVNVREHDANEEDGWRYKFDVIDLKWLDTDYHPIYTIAGGNSWEQAWGVAMDMIEQACAAPDQCVFI